jgi:hypothetical protein
LFIRGRNPVSVIQRGSKPGERRPEACPPGLESENEALPSLDSESAGERGMEDPRPEDVDPIGDPKDLGEAVPERPEDRP